jgi:hypothetical protein
MLFWGIRAMIEGALGTKPLVILVGLRFFQLSNQVIQS